MKKFFLATVLLGVSYASIAQSQVEALRFSRTTHLGTARFAAMGGAFTALGGDASTLAFNPAGIGVYRSSEFTLTGDLLYANTSVDYMGNTAKDDRYSFGLSNVALIGAYSTDNEKGLVNFNFGFAYNKTDKFNQRYLALGNYQDRNTYMDYFAQLGTNDGNYPDYLNNSEAGLAYDADLIGFDSASFEYYPFLANGDKTQGQQYAEIEGYLASYDFTLGANISNVLYLGLGVAITAVRYNETNVSSEYASRSNTTPFRNFDYTKEYRQTGTGYNFKFGAIAWPFANADFLNGLRIGGAVHTRTFLSMSNEYAADIYALFTDGYTHSWLTPNEFSYKIETPFKAMGGLAYVFSPSTPKGWRGIISADYEYVDYSNIKMRETSGYPANDPSDPHFNTSNANIASMYKAVNNLRFGGELGYQNTSFRLGYARYDNPYTSTADKNGTINIFSGGIGWQSSSFGINFTYSLSTQEDKQYMYYCEKAPGKSGDDIISDEEFHTIHQSNFFLSLGWRF